jgi:hypothetical protein
MNESWEAAFLATCATLDVTPEQAARYLDPAAVTQLAELVRGLRATSRSVRAGVLATTLAPVAMEIERMELR